MEEKKMASSLQDLLAEEGFRGRKASSQRTSFGYEGMSMPLYLYKDQNPAPASSSGKRTERTRSDVSRYSTGKQLLKTKGVRSQLPRENLFADRRITRETHEIEEAPHEIEEARGVDHNVSRLNSRLSVDNEASDGRRRSDVQEVRGYKDIFSNDVFEGERGKNGYSNGVKGGSSKLLPGRTSFSNYSSKSLQKQASTSSKTTKALHSQKHLNIEEPNPVPALDEAAVKATISILTGYIRRFLKEEEFRESIHDNCLSCLLTAGLEESRSSDNKVILSLEEAIETVERFAVSGDVKDLKKASFQLSVITSLSSKELKDGFVSGIPNALLSACGHLYLSVVYKLLKKDKVCAKHLLQVFCDSPLQARTRLLPELWDYLLLPNLSHLKVWYDQEASSLPDTSSRPRKLKLLGKVYNELLDSGTYQYAAYYKDWLTEGVEAPAVPSVHIPSVPVQGFTKGSLHGHSPEAASPIGSQPMISKKLYDSVFGRPSKPDDEVEWGEEEEQFDNCASSFGGAVEEEKKTVTCSPDHEKHIEQTFQGNATMTAAADANHHVRISPHQADESVPASEEGRRLREPQVTPLWRAPGSTYIPPHKKANDLILEKLAESVFQQPQARDHREVRDEGVENESLFSNTPDDFICPLTGELFEDPVTIETGQTFERTAIQEWFDKGKTTCPVTGKTLESLGVPVTNSVLKRVIGSWKSEHSKNLLSFASTVAKTSKDRGALLLLEQLLIGFKTEERLMNAKHLISLGGLQFLITRFELGGFEERSRIVVLLCRCVEADGSCRNYIAKNIHKGYLLELLHNKQAKSRADTVMLLTELICLHRRTEIMSFLRSIQKEGVMNTMHVLLVYLQSSPPDQKPLIAVLLLHLDLLVEPRKYSVYREEAVDSITAALECSLTDDKVRAQCCRSLLILGGHMSFSGELLIETWLLEHAGFYVGHGTDNLDNVEEDSEIDNKTLFAEEEKAREDWWKNLAGSLLGNGKKSFLEVISKCLRSGDTSLVRSCLVTVAWLSHALDAEFQLSAFSALIPRLKENLENGNQVENRVLASMALLNFSRISECRVLLMTIGEEILIPLQSLAVVTWTAKQLHATISGERW